MKSYQAHEIKNAWEILIDRLMIHGHAINNFILNNECLEDLCKAIKKKQLNFQLVPPHMHRQNAVERAICTFKMHFLSTLTTCDLDFPISGWDRLLPRSELTLNLVGSSRCNPRLSAFAYLHGNFNYNQTPLVPSGTRVMIHIKPTQRKSWDYHGQLG